MNRDTVITQARWLEVLTYCGVRASIAVDWAKLFEKHIQPSAFSQGERELDDYTGQVLHETSRLEHLEENLNYRPERLMQVWPERFPSLQIALQFAYNPEALAEKCYGMRADLGNDQPGDGFRYRGRGIPMITGKGNYLLLERLLGLPLVAYPDLLLDHEVALRCSIAWWEERVPDSAIDTLEAVSRAVQGGRLGLADRGMLTRRAAEKLRLGQPSA